MPTARVPQMRDGHPIWFHPGGLNIKLDSTERDIVFLEAKNAELTIEKTGGGIVIRWELNDNWFEVQGDVALCYEELATAFGVPWEPTEEDADEEPVLYCKWLIGRYGGDRAVQGKFIGYKQYLNIPGPGTGNDGDPNISVSITNDIKKAVGALLTR